MNGTIFNLEGKEINSKVTSRFMPDKPYSVIHNLPLEVAITPKGPQIIINHIMHFSHNERVFWIAQIDYTINIENPHMKNVPMEAFIPIMQQVFGSSLQYVNKKSKELFGISTPFSTVTPGEIINIITNAVSARN